MNAQDFGLKPGQELFEGNYKEDYRKKMTELREAGYIPWSTEDWMDARNSVNSNRPFWTKGGSTDFGIAGSKRKIYLTPHSERLRAVTPRTTLTGGGLTFDVNEATKAYNRSDLVLNMNLTEDEARASPVWLDFAAGDQNRLDKYVEKVFRFGKDKYRCDTMMGIFVPEDKVERAVALGGLEYWISAQANCVRLDYITSLVGVRAAK